MEIEDVPRIGFATGWTPKQQRQLPVGLGMGREIVVDDQRVFTMGRPCFGHGAPGEWSKKSECDASLRGAEVSRWC